MDTKPLPHPCDPLDGALPEVGNFSLVPGGPLYQLSRWTHLDDDVTSHVRQRIMVICGIIWLPLFIFRAIKGTPRVHDDPAGRTSRPDDQIRFPTVFL